MKPFDITKATTIKILSKDNKVLASYDTGIDPEESHSIMLFITNDKHTGCISNARITEILNVYAAILNILEDKGIDQETLEMLMALTKSNSKDNDFNAFMKRMMNS